MRGLVHTSDLADDLVGPSAAKTKLRSSSSTSSNIWRVLLNTLQSWLSPPRSNIYEAEDGDWREVQVAAKPKFSQVHLIYQTLYKISVRLDFAVNVFFPGVDSKRCGCAAARSLRGRRTRPRCWQVSNWASLESWLECLEFQDLEFYSHSFLLKLKLKTSTTRVLFPPTVGDLLETLQVEVSPRFTIIMIVTNTFSMIMIILSSSSSCLTWSSWRSSDYNNDE